MANTYKNIVITPNIGNTADPMIQFSGGNTSANTDISLYVYPTSNGTLSFEGSAGQLFSITNDLSGTLFSVNDVSGIPSIEVFANGLVSLAPLGGNVVVGNTAELILSAGAGLYANDSLGTAGHTLHSNGSSVYWAADDQGVTSVASGNGLTGGTITSTGTLSVVAGTGTVVNATGVHVNATYIGTLSANNTTYVNGKTEGNLNVNNATTALTANNSTNLGGVAAANYARTDAADDFSGVVTFNANAVLTKALSANGGFGSAGQVLTSAGAGNVYWSAAAGGVNTAAQYAWTNTHSFSSMVTFSNATSQSNTTAAAWFNQGGGAVAFDTNMVKRISWNDGAGNFNIRAGNYYNGTALVYNNDGTSGGAATISLNADGADGVITFNTWPIGVSGATVSGGTSMALNTTAFYIASNTTITGFANVGSYVNAASFNVVGTQFANTTGVYATFMNGKTEGNLNVNNATNATTLNITALGGSVDLNTLTTTAVYHQPANVQAASGSNYPIAEAGLLEVYASASMVYQRYTHFNTGRIYTRTKYTTTWNPWLIELDSGNYSSYALPLSGGSMTGSISFAANAGNGINLNGTDTTMHRIYMDSFYTIFKSHANEGWKFRDNNNVDRLTILGANGNMGTSGSISGGLFGIAADGNNRFIQGGLILRSTSPTIYFRDTDHNSAMIHNNSNLLYILRGGNDTESWSQVGGQWPFVWNLTNNDATCGGSFASIFNITAYASDERLKKDIECIKNPLDKVKQLRGITYKNNELANSYGFIDDAEQVGVLAQEIQKVLPQVIAPAPFDKQANDDGTYSSKSGENYMTVMYERITPLLIEAVKELSAKVDSLQEELKKLKGE